MSYSIETNPDVFSRQQVQQLTGVPNDVLQFWLREELLRPIPASSRKHRRFMPEQLWLAAILNEIRGLGANVSILRKLAHLFHRGREIVADLPFGTDLEAALKIASGLPAPTHPAPTAQSAELAATLTGDDLSAARMWCDLLDFATTYGETADDRAWLLWLDADGRLQLTSGDTDEFNFSPVRGLPPPRSALYLAVSECLAEVQGQIEAHFRRSGREAGAER